MARPTKLKSRLESRKLDNRLLNLTSAIKSLKVSLRKNNQILSKR